MNLSSLITLIIVLMLSSCSSMKSQPLTHQQASYHWIDKGGEFLYKRERGEKKITDKNKTRHEIITKEQLLDIKDESLEIERVVSISDVGQIDGITMLRPKSSEHLVWIDDKKKRTRLDIDIQKRVMVVKSSDSTEERVSFPQSNGAFCFFNQIVECATICGFLAKAISEESGEMNMTVVFTAYPYMKDLYPEIGNELFAPGTLTYEKALVNGKHQLVLDVAGQITNYIVTDKGELKEYYWSAQGISVKTGGGPLENPKLDE